MLKRLLVIFISAALLTGCSTETDIPPTLQDPVQADSDEEEARQVAVINQPTEVVGNNGWSIIPAGGQSEDQSEDQQQPQSNVLLNQEQAVRLFLEAWEQNDLEKMNMLTVQPLEDFFKQSDVSFASYQYLDNGDLAGFVRDGLARLKDYNIDSFTGAQIENPLPNRERLTVSMGDYLNFNIMLVLDRNMWKLKSMETLVNGIEVAEPQDWDTLGQTVIYDLKDMDGDGSYELLTMGSWGEWEGIGPEPSKAIGIYNFHDQNVTKLYFRDMSNRLEDQRVVIEGGMGRVMEDHPIMLVLIEKTAQDNLAVVDGPEAEQYISLYALEDGDLEKIGEIDWKSIISDVLENRNIPEWIELLGVRKLKEDALESLVLRVGLKDSHDVVNDNRVSEGIFVLSYNNGDWSTDWYHVDTFGEYHTVVFEQAGTHDHAVKMYYIEDSPDDEKKGGGVYQVYHSDGKWKDTRLFSDKMDIKAVGDMNGDGDNEFLVYDGMMLKVYSSDGEVLWSTNIPKDTKEIPYAWIGIVGGRQRVITALHIGDYEEWTSRIYEWKGKNFDLRNSWSSEPLGSDGITAMKVSDLDKDGEPEILVNYTNDYLIWGQFFKILEP